MCSGDCTISSLGVRFCSEAQEVSLAAYLLTSKLIARADADDPTYTTHHPIATTSKRITMHPVVPRSSAATQATEEVPEPQQKDTLPFGPPAVPRPLRNVNAEAGPSRTFSPEDGPPPVVAPALSAAFLAQDTTDPSLDFSIPEDGLPTREMVVIGGPGRPAKYGGQQEAADRKNAEKRHKEIVNEIEAATFGSARLGRPRARAKMVDLSEFGVPTWKRSKRVDRPQESAGESSRSGRGGGRGRGRGRGRGVTQETTPAVNSPLAEVTPGSPINAVSEMDLDAEEKEEGDENME